MGWSWDELRATPKDVVVALVDWLNERAREASAQQSAPAVTRPWRRR